jgi:hypothetical protein
MMKFHWFLLLTFLALAVGGCSASQATAKKSQTLPTEDTRPQQGRLQEPPIDPPGSDSTLPQLPAPTVGSVLITNVTATPVSPATSASALTPTLALQKLAERAREDLARRLSVSMDRIDLLKVVPAKWPYDSVGCPIPETESTNTPGYQILLISNDQQYMYHTDGKDWIGFCHVKPPNEIKTLP